MVSSLILISSATAIEANGLKDSIELKAEELQKISTEIEENQAKLNQAAAQKKSLQSEISKVNYTLKELTLGIRASGIQIEKIGLETSLIEEILKKSKKLKRWLALSRAAKSLFSGEKSKTSYKTVFSAGHGIGLIQDVMTTQQIIHETINHYNKIKKTLP